MRLVASIAMCAVITASSGCNFAVKHPSITAGLVVGSVGLATCSLTTSIGEGETSFTESGRAKCYGVTAIAGVGIGLLTAFAQWIGMEDADPPAPNQPGSIGDPTNLEPSPVFVPRPIIKPPPPASVEPVPEPTPQPPPADPVP